MAQTIIVDISTRGANPVAYTHQGDTGRTFFAEIYENGEAFAVAGYTIKVGAILPADRGYYVIAGNDMVTATKTNDNTTNKIYFTLSDKYSLKAGNGILTLIFTSNTGTPSTIRPINIDLRIQKSADADDTVLGASDWPTGLYDYMDNWLAENEPTEIANLKSDLKQTDESLSLYKISFSIESGQTHPSTKIIDALIPAGTPYYIKFSAPEGTQIAPKAYFSDASEQGKSVRSGNSAVKYIDNKDIIGFGFYSASTNPTGTVKVWVYLEASPINAVNLTENVQNDVDKISKIYNYFNYADAVDNNYLNSSGYLTEHTGYCVTNYIPVKTGDTVYAQYFGAGTPAFSHVCRYTQDKTFIDRIAASGTSYIADFDGYVRFNVSKGGTYLLNHLYCISLNDNNIDVEHKYGLVGIKEEADYAIQITKIDTFNYLIRFGDFSVILFYTDNTGSNSHNWNIKRVRHGENVLIVDGTDILGPIKINDNTDFIGGVHGDETTNSITVCLSGEAYNLEDIDNVYGNTLTLTIKSTVYDQDNPSTAMFDRYVQIAFERNKMYVSNTYKALSSCTLKRATNGGLLAATNPIIKNIIINNAFYSSAPTESVYIQSKENVCATINTIYGSMTVKNVSGHEKDTYIGYMQVFHEETPIRCKIYFDTYKEGSYPISSGDLITGAFEYLFS